MKLKLLETETNVKSKLNQKFASLIQRHCRKEPVMELKEEFIDEEEQQNAPTQFSLTQKEQSDDFHDHLERFWHVLKIFGFNA